MSARTRDRRSNIVHYSQEALAPVKLSANTKETAGVAFGWMLGDFPTRAAPKALSTALCRAIGTALAASSSPTTQSYRSKYLGSAGRPRCRRTCHAVMHVKAGGDEVPAR
jgi:hypothetical protein